MKNVLFGVDECTLVLRADPADMEEIRDWQRKAERMITEFARLADLEHIFGAKKDLDDTCPQGYLVAYRYGDHPFYFAIAYHPLQPAMGVIVKHSGYSWAMYCQKADTNIKRFLDAIRSDQYTVRISRIDITVDYQDWKMSVDDIYQGLKGNRLEIQDSTGKKNHAMISALEVDGRTGTFYVGSKKTGTRLFLRVYDKRAQQIETYGFRYEEALRTRSWVRFEVVYKGVYAHQMTDIIRNTKEEALSNLIADKVAEKFRFYDRKRKAYTDFSTALLEGSHPSFPPLCLESPRDHDLLRSLRHLVTGSGLFPTLYKCDKVWGDKASTVLLKHLYDVYTNKYEPNEDVRLWLKRHKETLQRQSLKEMLKL
ncbi:MAG: replication initiation factor domain-containing protein [Lachnospiraceae bacterium]|nr:replication initiation factor domain-containing protein [Lachnospiraceae bacterium]